MSCDMLATTGLFLYIHIKGEVIARLQIFFPDQFLVPAFEVINADTEAFRDEGE